MAATTSTARSRAYAILQHSDNSPAARRWRTFHFCALSAGLLAVALASIEPLPLLLGRLLTVVIVLVAVIFLAEYVVRVWAAPEASQFAGMSETEARLRWASSGTGLIGLLALLPAFAITTGTVAADSEAAAVFCIPWVAKLGLYAPAMGTLSRVISNERATLASVLIIFVIILVVAATATHLVERDGQPAVFGNIPASLWWAVVTLTTTGYGDVVPHTVVGKMIGSVVMVSGISVLR